MYRSEFKVSHDLPIGPMIVNDLTCHVLPDLITCSSVRIQKGWARKLSTQYGKCQYDWNNEEASGTVVYVNGHKKHEVFTVK